MSKVSEYDFDDDDIFVVRRRKPVGRLTMEKALEIRRKVLNSMDDNESSTNSLFDKSKNKNKQNKSSDSVKERRNGVLNCNSDDEISILEERITTTSQNIGRISMENQNTTHPIKNITPTNSPSKVITDYFTPSKRKSAGSNESTNDNIASTSDDEKKFKMKRKKFKSEPFDAGHASPSKFKTDEQKSNGGVSSKSDDLCNSVLEVRRRRVFGTSYYYSKSLKGIVHHEILNQASLEREARKDGKKFGRLITVSEFCDVERFFKLPENAFELFARMLCRKKGWHRISTIIYVDINGKVEDIFRCLNMEKFVDFDVNKESIEIQLNLLSKPEIQFLCKALNIKVAGTKKCDFIDSIVKSGKSQRSVSDMWKKDSTSKREQMLRNEIVRMLGPCMKLNESFLSFLNRLLLLFSLPHNIIEDNMWSTQIHMMTEVYTNNACYPNYEVKPTVIFQNRNDLIFFEKAMGLLCHLDGALLSKNNEEFTAIGQEAKKEFKQLLGNDGFRERVSYLPQFLRRYNAGSVYAKILTTYCEKYKKRKAPDEVVEIMEMLINQDVFSVSKKGKWYCLLVQAYIDLGKSLEAGSALLAALKGNFISEVERLVLQYKGGLLLKKKKNALKEGELRDELDDHCTIDVTEPSKVEIRARALDMSEVGCKKVYMYRDKAGALSFSSVEETVINHYKENGFSKGVHAEGSIIQTMYFLVFFDIIYELSPPGVFQNPYQHEPLDFSSKSFYLNRKFEIDIRLKEMRRWSVEKFEKTFTEVYTKNLGVYCVITWSDEFTPNIFCEILKCLGIQEFTSICERLVHNFRVYRSGFPDLTVWNPSTRKCKFVEVKSPKDKLSPNQRLWLDFLRKLSVDCEVCNVKNIASRKIKS